MSDNDIPRFISLGAGVQSSTMALMAAHGELTPMPKAAIFADTQAEPVSVYRWLDWLEKQLPFPVYRVTKGSLYDESKRIKRSKTTGRLYVREVVPAFLKMDDGRVQMLWRRCTRDYKIRPILAKVRELAKVPARNRKRVYCVQWIGISIDEASRIKPSREAWVENHWPLIDHNMSRADCLAWMRSHGYPEPPRSACVFCPYHSDAEWLRLKAEAPEDFNRAARWEDELRQAATVDERYIGTVFAWRGCEPLPTAQFKDDSAQGDLFANECEGMCGV